MLKKKMNLRDFNTFGIDVSTSSFIEIKNEKQASELLSSGKLNPSECLVIGGGSNILFTEDFNGTVLHPVFNNISIVARGQDKVFISAEAGVEWDKLVSWAVNMGMGGIENLSWIPGHAGAAPIQNIGAYGTEVADTITKVRAISLEDGSIREFTREECGFGYRNSIFKNELKNKYLITTLFFELTRNPSIFNLSYGDLEKRVIKKGDINLFNIRETVIETRMEKLPDPSETGNAGSFFKNPVTDKSRANSIIDKFPDMPSWHAGGEEIKIPAAWLIEKAGFKGYRSGNAGVHPMQPLVLVNHGNATGKEILELAIKIRESVLDRFGISLEFEVNVV